MNRSGRSPRTGCRNSHAIPPRHNTGPANEYRRNLQATPHWPGAGDGLPGWQGTGAVDGAPPLGIFCSWVWGGGYPDPGDLLAMGSLAPSA